MKEMKAVTLEPNEARLTCDPDKFNFETTRELHDSTEVIGQERLISSIDFGTDIKQHGYNIFALGSNQTNKRVAIEKLLENKAEDQSVPDDLCYVNNFDKRHKPQLLRLPPGVGKKLEQKMDEFVREIETALQAAFESEEYQNRRQSIEEEVQEDQGRSFEELQKKAREQGYTIMRTPNGFAFAPIKDGDVMDQNEIQELPEEERDKMQEDIEELQKELQEILRKVPAKKREIRKELKKLDREVAAFAINDLLDELKSTFEDYEQVINFLEKVKQDIIENVKQIISDKQNQMMQMMQQQQGDNSTQAADNSILNRYKVNSIVDNSSQEGAPVIYEDNPMFKNLVGRVEYKASMGGFSTNFNLIRAGSLHRANGGYLLIDARSLLMEPFAWEGLKRALKSGKIKIENPGESYRMISTVSLEPETVDLDVKIILFGERMVYYLLCEYDPDFSSLFKVEADFEDDLDRTDDIHEKYSQFIAGLVHESDIRHLNREAVAKVVERSSRLAGDNEKLSAKTKEIEDLLLQSDHWAGKNGTDIVTEEHVQKAIEQQDYRSARLKDRAQESILRETVYIDTTGEKVAQINGLSVLQIGNLMFGRPTRITARVQMGKGDIVNIEREVELSGPIHSKGVLILKGFMGERYGRDKPLAFSASLVFEQSYGGIDGDSASSTELYALLSAIAKVPIKQSLAVTGSVNQHGEIQPIGGVNEKIEGFFDICHKRGLTGKQGVLIPNSNVKNLMLRSDVVEAIKEDQFDIYPIETIDEGMQILTGKPMGERTDGEYPEGSINKLVEENLADFAEQRKKFMMPKNGRDS